MMHTFCTRVIKNIRRYTDMAETMLYDEINKQTADLYAFVRNLNV